MIVTTFLYCYYKTLSLLLLASCLIDAITNQFILICSKIHIFSQMLKTETHVYFAELGISCCKTYQTTI